MTKAYNRNYLNTIVARYKATKQSVVCAIVDIDHFKSINDTHGHLFGDHALKFLSGLLQRQLRRNNFVFRFGGEEFILLIDTDDLPKGVAIIDRLRQTLEKSSISMGGVSCKMNFSAGIQYCDDGDIMKSLEQADIKLYKAKENGRNQVVYEL